MARTNSGRPEDEYTLGKSAEEIYKSEVSRRDIVRDRARDVARVTIPSLVPPDGYQEGDKLYTPYQGVGARGVNNIASRLLLTLMPPERPLFAHQFPDDLSARLKQDDEEAYGKLTLALSKRALRVTSRADTTPLRATLFQTLRLLIVAGNALLQYDNIDEPCVHGMERYIVKRDRRGNPLLIILQEDVGWNSLPEALQQAVEDPENTEFAEARGKDPWERVIPVYTVCQLVGTKTARRWRSWQECGRKLIPDTTGQYPFDAPPMYPLWMIPSYGFDWGRSYADEYIGDLISVDNYAKALGEGAALAALALVFVKPGSQTKRSSVENANNLDVLAGNAADVSVFRSEKQNDFRFVNEILESTVQRLQFAFILNSAIQRNGERVTAEEIKLMARELDEAMGGVYAIFSQTLQRYVVNRLVYCLEKDGELPKVPTPKGYQPLRVKIVTGIDSLGNSRDVELLDEFVQPLLQIPEAVARINLDDYMRRKAAGLGINPDGLIKDDKDVQAAQQQDQQTAQQAALLQHGTGPAINAMGQVGKAMMSNPQQQQSIDPNQIGALLQQLQQQQQAPAQ